MSTTSSPVSLRSWSVFSAVLALTVAVTTLSFWGALPLESGAFAILMGVVVLTGIPHGAVDHLVAAQLYDLDASWTDQAKFYGFYLALMALYGGLWLVAPVASLAVFLVMTMYHFGQADLAYLASPDRQHRLAYLSRGLFLIGLPIAAFPNVVAPIFDAIVGTSLSGWALLMHHQTAVVGGLIAQHGLVLVALWAGGVASTTALGRELLSVAVLSLLFYTVHPLVAFAVYFGFWHSLGHILELIRFFNQHDQPTSLVDFYRKAMLFTVLSFVLLGALYAAGDAFGTPMEMIALLFILISVMTLPHMIIVERLYQQRKGHPA
ncbi:MAG: beta-carotene 15,15'-dioxygenase, Brp/Blh family [Bacteroidetes bacterium]|nr:beta-carotene 15,15'-dioxygenase, Brp/Blh family [Bacteroidota bacterium]